MYHFFRLIRLPNLLFIILTQYSIRYFVITPIFQVYNVNHTLDEIQFGLLVLSTILIAAAGYIINDYFDADIDSINKPSRLLVGKIFKRSHAMALHFVFNIAGVGLGVYLGWILGNYQLGFFHFMAVGMLWFYSTSFKKQFLIGNIIVSAMTGLVVLIVGFYEIMLYKALSHYTREAAVVVIWIMLGYTFFAFQISLIREIVKDMEDIEGDSEFGSRTLPLVLGLKNARIIILVLGIILIATIGYAQSIVVGLGEYISLLYSILLIQFPLIFMLYQVTKAREKDHYRRLSNIIKGIMLTGIVSMIFFWLFIMPKITYRVPLDI